MDVGSGSLWRGAEIHRMGRYLHPSVDPGGHDWRGLHPPEMGSHRVWRCVSLTTTDFPRTPQCRGRLRPGRGRRRSRRRRRWMRRRRRKPGRASFPAFLSVRHLQDLTVRGGCCVAVGSRQSSSAGEADRKGRIQSEVRCGTTEREGVCMRISELVRTHLRQPFVMQGPGFKSRCKRLFSRASYSINLIHFLYFFV